jgi:hypothetical protein
MLEAAGESRDGHERRSPAEIADDADLLTRDRCSSDDKRDCEGRCRERRS